MTDLDLTQRVEDLEARETALLVRISAHEWLIEQMFSHYLLSHHPDTADGFLQGISDHGLPSFRQTEEGPMRAPPTLEQQLQADVKKIADKIRVRVRQGFRGPGSPRVPPRQQ